jgi:hypothetical protein
MFTPIAPEKTPEVSSYLPTAASQIEELARLRDSGLVAPEEFEWKK